MPALMTRSDLEAAILRVVACLEVCESEAVEYGLPDPQLFASVEALLLELETRGWVEIVVCRTTRVLG